jgi:hypothetical protein
MLNKRNSSQLDAFVIVPVFFVIENVKLLWAYRLRELKAIASIWLEKQSI